MYGNCYIIVTTEELFNFSTYELFICSLPYEVFFFVRSSVNRLLIVPVCIFCNRYMTVMCQ